MPTYTAKDITGKSIPLFTNWILAQNNLHLYFQDFIDSLFYCDYFHAITYTVDPLYLKRCRKLIYASMKDSRNVGIPAACKAIQATNVHTKLYIVYKNKKPTVWVATGNLCGSKYLHNIAIKVPRYSPNYKTLLMYFDNMWSLCSTSSQKKNKLTEQLW